MRAHPLAVTLATFHQLSVASHQPPEWPQYGQANRSSFGLQRICLSCSQPAPSVPNRSRNVLMSITAGFGSQAFAFPYEARVIPNVCGTYETEPIRTSVALYFLIGNRG